MEGVEKVAKVTKVGFLEVKAAAAVDYLAKRTKVVEDLIGLEDRLMDQEAAAEETNLAQESLAQLQLLSLFALTSTKGAMYLGSPVSYLVANCGDLEGLWLGPLNLILLCKSM